MCAYLGVVVGSVTPKLVVLLLAQPDFSPFAS